MATSVLPSPVRISAILPLCSTMPPISWTSKWRMPSARLPASRTDGEGLGQQGVERLAVGDALLELVGLGAQLVVGQRRDRRLERVDVRARPAPYCFSRRSLRLPNMRVRILEIIASGEKLLQAIRRMHKKQGVRTASPLRSLVPATSGQPAACRNRAGFCGTPLRRTSKCRCGPVDRPVVPTSQLVARVGPDRPP